MNPSLASESAATRNGTPGGTVTRPIGPGGVRPHATISATSTDAATTRAPRVLRSESKRMLQEDGGGERIDIALPPACRAAHVAHRAQRRGRGVALVDERDGELGPLLELGGDVPHFGGARRVI